MIIHGALVKRTSLLVRQASTRPRTVLGNLLLASSPASNPSSCQSGLPRNSKLMQGLVTERLVRQVGVKPIAVAAEVLWPGLKLIVA